MRAATGDIFLFFSGLVDLFLGLGGRDECFSIAERLYCLWVCARRFLAKFVSTLQRTTRLALANAFRVPFDHDTQPLLHHHA